VYILFAESVNEYRTSAIPVHVLKDFIASYQHQSSKILNLSCKKQD